MGRRAPYIRDRGVSNPPPGYRPGRKAGWLHPRPPTQHIEVPDMPFELQTATYSWDDSGFVSPADNGAPYLSIPAGKFVEIALIQAEVFDQPGEIDAYLCPDPATSGAQMGNYCTDTPGPPTPASLPQLQYGNATSFQYFGTGGPTGFTIVPCVICLGFFPATLPPSQGFGTLVAKIYS